ncbi:heme NO-binding domain-containing protein [Sanyastnella coralliicola]|uniref:heme NO-binding domain-containing protein n=1 Tax=Sanyastnella coralliicola TaxID=3069118 RepID=UPI0027B92271|nr:heme NO-binding domain-containing protein [Longitalea sp. SCSIO 12813]
MKGVVFTEFLEMVEDKFGFDVADKIISNADLPSGGVYTAVGTYEHSEMVQLVTNLSGESGLSIPQLLNAYGNHLFTRFAAGYGQFFTGVTDGFVFLEQIEGYIHVEVRKLYPDAELPSFETKRIDDNTLEMIYTSERRMADFAEGLIEGCATHFNETYDINKENIEESGKVVRFTINRS